MSVWEFDVRFCVEADGREEARQRFRDALALVSEELADWRTEVVDEDASE